MKHIIFLALFVLIGCIVAAGCVEITNKNTLNSSAPAATFAPFSSDPDTTNGTTGLKGPLVISISGYPANLPVILDRKNVGTVKPTAPLSLMVPEGNHTVMVCVGWVCEYENVTTSFGRHVNVDFGERLRKDVEFPNATARILEYYQNGNGVSVNVEFINPETVDHTIFVELGVGYSYIDGRTQIKYGSSAKGTSSLFVKAGQRETKRVDLSFTSSGSRYSFDYPVITEIKVM
jgi:hypothetical protein